jgi:acetoin utilization deacetylase AcuC-like enzyme
VAFYAAGGALRGVDAVLGGEVDKAFALIRPPGHHATLTKAMGFCLFNNIAIAAKYALNKHKLRRILIADFDVHHGNGTQEIFYGDSKVLYFSTHQYPFYPGTGSVNEIGKGLGKGTTVNVPLSAWCGDSEYQRAYEEVLVPIARKFKPDLLLVSAGYDPHWADQISMMQLSVDGFAEIVNILRELADELCHGRAVFLLEGGYHLEALSYSVKASLDVLLENPRTPDPLGSIPQTGQAPPVDSIIEGVKAVHGIC